MKLDSSLIWILLPLLSAYYVYSHFREKSREKALLATLPSETQQRLKRYGFAITAQLFVLVLALNILVLAFLWNQQKTTQDTQTLKHELQEIKTALKAPKITIATPTATAETTPLPLSNMESIFDPEKLGSDQISKLDSIKKRYEDILVTHYFLKRCGRVSENDFYVISSALSNEMASVNAPGRLHYDITFSAKGSYAEIYAKSPCDAATIASIQSKYDLFINSISQKSTNP